MLRLIYLAAVYNHESEKRCTISEDLGLIWPCRQPTSSSYGASVSGLNAVCLKNKTKTFESLWILFSRGILIGRKFLILPKITMLLRKSCVLSTSYLMPKSDFVSLRMSPQSEVQIKSASSPVFDPLWKEWHDYRMNELFLILSQRRTQEKTIAQPRHNHRLDNDLRAPPSESLLNRTVTY